LKIKFNILLAILCLTISNASFAAFITFDNKENFLELTGAESATGDLPAKSLGTHGSVKIGSLNFIIQRFSIADWSSRLSGNEIGISYGADGLIDESIRVFSDNNVYAFGFEFVEPKNDPNVNVPTPVDSSFRVSLYNNNTALGSFIFNAPEDQAYFVGVLSDTSFNKVDVFELGGSDNEFYGEFYTSQVAPVPLPASLPLFFIGIASVLFAGFRRKLNTKV
jgi:hypothetical protein